MWSPHDHTGVRCMCEVIWKMLQHVGLDKRQWFVKVLVTTTTMWCHIDSNTVSVQYMDSYGKYIYMNIMNNQQDILGQTAISPCSCQSQVGTNPLHSPSLFFFYTTLSYIIYICRLTYKLHWRKKNTWSSSAAPAILIYGLLYWSGLKPHTCFCRGVHHLSLRAGPKRRLPSCNLLSVVPFADVNECQDPSYCKNGRCENTPGSFHCFCSPPLTFSAALKQCVYDGG